MSSCGLFLTFLLSLSSLLPVLRWASVYVLCAHTGVHMHMRECTCVLARVQASGARVCTHVYVYKCMHVHVCTGVQHMFWQTCGCAHVSVCAVPRVSCVHARMLPMCARVCWGEELVLLRGEGAGFRGPIRQQLGHVAPVPPDRGLVVPPHRTDGFPRPEQAVGLDMCLVGRSRAHAGAAISGCM